MKLKPTSPPDATIIYFTYNPHTKNSLPQLIGKDSLAILHTFPRLRERIHENLNPYYEGIVLLPHGIIAIDLRLFTKAIAILPHYATNARFRHIRVPRPPEHPGVPSTSIDAIRLLDSRFVLSF